MTRISAVVVLAGLCLADLLPADEIRLTPQSVLRFASADEAARLLGAPDEFVTRMSPFDRAARLKTDRPVSQEEFLQFAAGTARAWKAEEISRLTRAIVALKPKLSRLNLNFPKTILLVKTAGGEAGAAHTRLNAVILPQAMVASSRTDWEQLLAHELLHVLTRHNPELRRSLYAAIGFRPCNEIELPEQFNARRITNPDAPWNDSYITVSVNRRKTAVVPILFSKEEKYDPQKGGSLFRYLNFQLLAIDQTDGQWKARLRQGEPVLWDVGEVSGFHEQVGRNTRYIIHPEEIIADNFALLVIGKKDPQSPQIVAKIRRILSAEPPKLKETSKRGVAPLGLVKE